MGAQQKCQAYSTSIIIKTSKGDFSQHFGTTNMVRNHEGSLLHITFGVISGANGSSVLRAVGEVAACKEEYESQLSVKETGLLNIASSTFNIFGDMMYLLDFVWLLSGYHTVYKVKHPLNNGFGSFLYLVGSSQITA